MPLTYAKAGEEVYIKRIGGKSETKQFLESLGFTVGSMVRVLSMNGGNLIVQVKDSRIALSREMAAKIMI